MGWFNNKYFSMYDGKEDEKFMLPKSYNEQGDNILWIYNLCLLNKQTLTFFIVGLSLKINDTSNNKL